MIKSISEMLATLSPYSPTEAAAIVEAIATCRPLSEIVALLKCSHNDLDNAAAKAGEQVLYGDW